MLTRTPARANSLAASTAPGSSGAIVTTFTTPSASTSATSSGSGTTALGG